LILRKKLASRTITPKTNPIELYGTLDRKSVAGPLRPAQEIVLSEWYTKRRTNRDLIIKLHTGEGKTLVGLLLLQSLLNSKEGPCLIYVLINILSGRYVQKRINLVFPFVHLVKVPRFQMIFLQVPKYLLPMYRNSIM
jgi:replicative superfamily II helicase